MKIQTWLKKHNVQDQTITLFIPELRGDPFELKIPAQVMNPDLWFYFPNQTRFVLIGQCSNGDGIAVDTENSDGVCYIAGELAQEKIPLEKKFIRVASSLAEYLKSRNNESFPMDFWDAVERKA